jgi:hypothetical protein
VYAAPPNDNFAGASVIAGGLPLEVSGGNAEATNEAGEPIPTGGRGTVWWRWTPASTGWVAIETVGALDTVLAVYGGSSLGTLERLAFNDDADLDATGPSRVMVHAEAGATLQIQVSGYDGETGLIRLVIATTPPPPVVTAITLTPASADVSTNEVTVTLQATVTSSSSPVVEVWSTLTRAGVDDVPFNLAAMTRTAGTNLSGTYRGSFIIPRYLPAGALPLYLSARLADGTLVTFGERTSRPATLPHALTVVNTGSSDADPPALTAFTLSPSATVDVAASAQTVEIAVRVVDRPAGTRDFDNRFRMGGPGGLIEVEEVLSYRNRVSGDQFDGTYRFSVVVPRGAPPGTYPMVLELADIIDNTVVFASTPGPGQSAFPEGFPSVLTVVNSGLVDTQPPALTASSVVPSTLNALAQEPAKVVFTVTDALSGVGSVEIHGSNAGLRPVAGGAVIPLSIDFSDDPEVAGAGQFGSYLYIPTSTPAGEYELVGLRATDVLGNSIIYGPAAFGFTPYPAGTVPRLTVTREIPVTPYSIWIAQFPSLTGAEAGRLADPDGDSFVNLVELALGLDPTLSSAPNGADPARIRAPKVTQTANRLSLAYSVATANLGTGPFRISVMSQESTDFLHWDGAQTFILGGGEFEAFTSIVKGQKRALRLLVVDPSAP